MNPTSYTNLLYINYNLTTKKMKTKLQFIAAIVFAALASVNLHAQKSYFSLNMGYGFKNASSSNYFVNIQEIEDMGDQATVYENVYFSFGQGAHIGFSYGYMFNQNIGMDLGFSYFKGSQVKGEMEIVSTSWGKYSSSQIASANMLRITPSLVLSCGLERLNPYGKFGVVLGSAEINNQSEEFGDGNYSKYEIKFNGGLAVGYTSAIGLSYNLTDDFSLFGEMNIVGMNYAPTKGEILMAEENGRDVLYQFDKSEREFVFLDKVEYRSDSEPSSNEPSEGIKTKFPFSSIGFNMGAKYSF